MPLNYFTQAPPRYSPVGCHSVILYCVLELNLIENLNILVLLYQGVNANWFAVSNSNRKLSVMNNTKVSTNNGGHPFFVCLPVGG